MLLLISVLTVAVTVALALVLTRSWSCYGGTRTVTDGYRCPGCGATE